MSLVIYHPYPFQYPPGHGTHGLWVAGTVSPLLAQQIAELTESVRQLVKAVNEKQQPKQKHPITPKMRRAIKRYRANLRKKP
jgi:hypothetical protein